MLHIGMIIRQKRQEQKLSAEFIAQHLQHPISKQAFAKKERTGSFSYNLVLEVAKILGCSLADLENPSKKSTRLKKQK